MAKDALAIDDREDRIRIVWELATETSEQSLAKMTGSKRRNHRKGTGIVPHWIASVAASKTVGVCHDDDGFYWDTIEQATAALVAINMSLAGSPSTLPDWARQALAEGWTPPKGWIPR